MEKRALRGGPAADLSPCVWAARWIEPHLRRHWHAEWRACPLDSMTGSLRSRGTAMRAIRSPQGVMEDLPSSPRRPPPRRGTVVRALRALREVQYHRNATLPAQEENCWGLQVEAQASLRFQGSNRKLRTQGGVKRKSLIRRSKKISEACQRGAAIRLSRARSFCNWPMTIR